LLLAGKKSYLLEAGIYPPNFSDGDPKAIKASNDLLKGPDILSRAKVVLATFEIEGCVIPGRLKGKFCSLSG